MPSDASDIHGPGRGSAAPCAAKSSSQEPAVCFFPLSGGNEGIVFIFLSFVIITFIIIHHPSATIDCQCVYSLLFTLTGYLEAPVRSVEHVR